MKLTDEFNWLWLSFLTPMRHIFFCQLIKMVLQFTIWHYKIQYTCKDIGHFPLDYEKFWNTLEPSETLGTHWGKPLGGRGGGIKKIEKFPKKMKISGTLWNLLEPWGHIGVSPWGGAEGGGGIKKLKQSNHDQTFLDILELHRTGWKRDGDR